MRLLVTLGFFLLAAASAQDEAALRRYFEGKSVRAKMDLPGTHLGVDVWPLNREAPLETRSYATRIRQYGRAVSQGESILITAVKVKKDHLEIHLGGGGYGTFWDDKGAVTSPYATASPRERDLERQIAREKDASRRSQLRRELEREREWRRRREFFGRERLERERERKALEIAQRRREGGSRFNLRYAEAYFKETFPTPEQVVAALAEYLEFGAGMTPPEVSPDGLRRGMPRAEVHEKLGKPPRTRKHQQGELDVETDIWESAARVVEVDFIGDVAIGWRVARK